MQDAARLLLGAGHDGGALALRQHVERPEGDASVEGEQHPAREEGVPPEDRHEPRCAGGEDHPVGMGRIRDAQTGEVIGAGLEELDEPWLAGTDPGALAPPLRVLEGGAAVDVRRADGVGAQQGRAGHGRFHADGDGRAVPRRRRPGATELGARRPAHRSR